MAGSNLAGVARVAFEADTGEFNRDIAAVERRYNESTGRMSDDTIRLGLAQDKLRRALDRYGPTSQAAQRATLALRSAQRQAEGQTERTARAIDREERSLGRLGRGALSGAGALGHLRGAAAFASSSFLGGFGLTYALRSTVEAANEAQQVQDGLRVTLNNLGIGYEQNRREIDRQIQAQSRLSSFDDEVLLRSFTNLVRRTGDVSQALRLNAVAADIARARHTDLESVSTLLIRALAGNARAATSLGLPLVTVTKNADALARTTGKVTVEQRRAAAAADRQATGLAILDEAQRRYGGRAAAYAQSAAGRQEYLNKVINDSQEIIGRALTPALAGLATRLAAYLTRLNETGELQRDVNKAVEAGTEVAHGLADGFRAVRSIVVPLNDALGGTRETVKLLGLGFASLKIGRVVTGLGGIGAAAGEAGAAGEVGLLTRRLGGLNALTIAPILIPITYEITTKILDATGVTPWLGRAGGRIYDVNSGAAPSAFRGGQGNPFPTFRPGQQITPEQIDALRRAHPELTDHDFGVLLAAAINPRTRAMRPDDRAVGGRRNPDVTRRRGGRGGSGGGDANPPGEPGTGIPWLDNLLARDEATAGRGDDERDIRRAIAVLRGRLSRAKSLAARTDLQRAINQFVAQLDALENDDRQAVADAIARRRAAAQARRERLAEQARIAQERAEHTVDRRVAGYERLLALAGGTERTSDDLRILGLEERYLADEVKNLKLSESKRDQLDRERTAVIGRINAIRHRKKATIDTTAAGRAQQAFIGELSGILGQFASNVTGQSAAAGVGNVVNITQNIRSGKTQFAALREARLAAAHVF